MTLTCIIMVGSRIHSRHSNQFIRCTSPYFLYIVLCQLFLYTDGQEVGKDVPDQWLQWSEWTPCSATCGPGIHTRSRQCASALNKRPAGYPTPMCEGVSNETKVCQTIPCPPGDLTAHEIACSKFNTRAFSGKQYVWEPFSHSRSPCKLACRAKGKHFYANLSGRKPDGSSCGKGPSEAICLGGLCKSIGCDEVVGSPATRDACGVCQGDGSSCQTISGIFMNTDLRRGLNDVITIPAGSSNINITEIETSRNLLLLQTLEGKTILNGGSRRPVSGEVRGAGTSFTYSQISLADPKKSIFALGPTDVGIKVKILLRGRNPGLMYSFNVPLEKSDDFLRKINHQKAPVHIPNTEDSARERYGVSRLEARPYSSSLQVGDEEISSVTASQLTNTLRKEQLKQDYETSTPDNNLQGTLPGSKNSPGDAVSLTKHSYSDVQNEAASPGDEKEKETDARNNVLSGLQSSEIISESNEDVKDDEVSTLTPGSNEESYISSEEGEEEEGEYEIHSSESDDEEYGDSVSDEINEDQVSTEELISESSIVSEEEHEIDDSFHDSDSIESTEHLENVSYEEVEEESGADRNSNEINSPTLETTSVVSERYTKFVFDQDRSNRIDSEVDLGKPGGSKGDRRNHDSAVQKDTNYRDASEEKNFDSPTIYEPSGTKLPKYSQSFTFAQRYKTNAAINNVQNAGWTHRNQQKHVLRPNKMVSIGLQYVDDKNGNGNKLGHTLTIGNNVRATQSRRSQQVQTLPTPSSTIHTVRWTSLPTQPSSMRLPTRRVRFISSRPTQHHQRWQQYYGTSRNSGGNRRKHSYIARQREERKKQREAILEARRRRQQEQQERYNQRLRAYQERLNQRNAEIAARRSRNRASVSLQAKTQWRIHPSSNRRKSVSFSYPSSSTTGTFVQKTAEDVGDSRNIPVQSAANNLRLKPKSTRTSATNSVIPRHYGKDGLYATEESAEIVNQLAKNIPSSNNATIRTEPNDITEQRIPVFRKTPTQTHTIQENTLSRVVSSRPNIIPRIRSPDPLDSSSRDLRPSIISALGGASPQTSRVDSTNHIVQDPRSTYVRTETRPLVSGVANSNAGVIVYVWRISGLTDCTVTCGGGVQQTVVVCIDTTSQAVVTDDNCVGINKPDRTAVQCNKRPCPAEWYLGPWSSCSATCGRGERTRFVTCHARVSPTLNITIETSKCEGTERPAHIEQCNLKSCSNWKIGNWSQCSARCGEGVRTREVECVSITGDVIPSAACLELKPHEQEACDLGPCGKGWFFQEWTEECSVECGTGEITRKVFCSGESGEVIPHDRCDPNQKPPSTKQCRASRPCGGHWFTGPWTKCNAACGEGRKSRGVICVKSLPGGLYATVGEENCLAELKPSETETCEISECTPEWYMTSWDQCSKSCDTGVKSRDVKCLSPDQTPSDRCSLADKPKTREPCNTQPCRKNNPDRRKSNETHKQANCTDSWSHCPIVRRTNLCKHGFYRKHCCKSCWDHKDN